MINHGNSDRFGRTVFHAGRVGRIPLSKRIGAPDGGITRNARWQCVVNVDEEEGIVFFHSVCPLKVSVESRPRIAEFLMRLNRTIYLGHFVATLALCADRPGKVISFCMGALGTVSRVVSMRVGAPLAYASIPNAEVAPGQLSISTMRRLRSMVA